MTAPKIKDAYGKVVDGKTIKRDSKEKLPTSAFAEPSEPSNRAPEDNSKAQLTGPQEENPQVIAHKPKSQPTDEKNTKSKSLKSKL